MKESELKSIIRGIINEVRLKSDKGEMGKLYAFVDNRGFVKILFSDGFTISGVTGNNNVGKSTGDVEIFKSDEDIVPTIDELNKFGVDYIRKYTGIIIPKGELGFVQVNDINNIEPVASISYTNPNQ